MPKKADFESIEIENPQNINTIVDMEQHDHDRIMSRSIHHISIFSLWAVFSLFVVLVALTIVLTILISVGQEINRTLFAILLAFLSGFLGAGFGDKIIKRIGSHWDKNV